MKIDTILKIQSTQNKFNNRIQNFINKNELDDFKYKLPIKQHQLDKLYSLKVNHLSNNEYQVLNTNSRFDLFSEKSKSTKRYFKNEQYLINHKKITNNSAIFMTITNNLHDQNLQKQYNDLSDRFRRFYRSVNFKNNFYGCIKNVEITFNEKKESWNLHLHVVLFPKKNYFKKSNKYYLNNEELLKWFEAIVNLKSINMNSKNSIKEISKYNAKMWDITKLKDKYFLEYINFIKGKRLIEYKFSKSLKYWVQKSLEKLKLDWLEEFNSLLIISTFSLNYLNEYIYNLNSYNSNFFLFKE